MRSKDPLCEQHRLKIQTALTKLQRRIRKAESVRLFVTVDYGADDGVVVSKEAPPTPEPVVVELDEVVDDLLVPVSPPETTPDPTPLENTQQAPTSGSSEDI